MNIFHFIKKLNPSTILRDVIWKSIMHGHKSIITWTQAVFSSSADILCNIGQGKSVADFMLKADNPIEHYMCY